jgi:hypothetical protein
MFFERVGDVLDNPDRAERLSREVRRSDHHFGLSMSGYNTQATQPDLTALLAGVGPFLSQHSATTPDA